MASSVRGGRACQYEVPSHCTCYQKFDRTRMQVLHCSGVERQQSQCSRPYDLYANPAD